MKSKCIAFGIILLFVATGIIPSVAQKIDKPPQPVSGGHWLYVGGSGPGNYTSIQSAIDNSSNGDSVFVFDDTSPYYENICINKEIKVIGEDKNSTTIDGRKVHPVIRITANNSSIEQFTLRNTSFKWPEAIDIGSSHDILVRNNIIKDCYLGIDCAGSFCEISYNLLQVIENGIISKSTSNLFIHHNVFQGASTRGLNLFSYNCIIANNVFNDSRKAIDFWACFRNKIYDNTFLNNIEGIHLEISFFNFFYRNSFIGNDIDAYFTSILPFTTYNRWTRNYWDDLGVLHVKRIPGNTVIPVGPEGFLINRSNFDWRPVREPYDIPRMN
jgi:parallel beta-helix repeat protein